MNRPIIKFIVDFGPLLVFFTIYFYGENDLRVAIPPFIIATLIALVVVYFVSLAYFEKTFLVNFFLLNIDQKKVLLQKAD